MMPPLPIFAPSAHRCFPAARKAEAKEKAKRRDPLLADQLRPLVSVLLGVAAGLGLADVHGAGEGTEGTMARGS